MSTILHFPDVYSGDKGINFSSSYVVIAKATQGLTYKNPEYTAFQHEARADNVFFIAYHFLERGNAAQQAQFAFSVVGKTVPLAVDCESYLSSHPRLIDLLEFIDAYRALGGIIHIVYLPRWYWSEFLGSPDLSPLVVRRCWLWTSNYPDNGYSDNGPGWFSYGNAPIAIWQYADNIAYGGIPEVDFNAFRGTGHQTTYEGTLAELEHLSFTGILTANVHT